VAVERGEEPHSHDANLNTIGAGPTARQHNKPDEHYNPEQHQAADPHRRNLAPAPDNIRRAGEWVEFGGTQPSRKLRTSRPSRVSWNPRAAAGYGGMR
jgi:hypothetical protein